MTYNVDLYRGVEMIAETIVEEGVSVLDSIKAAGIY